MSVGPIIAFVLLFLGGAGTWGADPELPAEAVPFVPDGFAYEYWVPGDLNGDGVDDLALVLVAASHERRRPRRLVVLARRTDGRLQPIGQSTRLLRCDGCFDGPDLQDVRIEKGLLVVVQGGYEASWGGTWRFRFEPASGKLPGRPRPRGAGARDRSVADPQHQLPHREAHLRGDAPRPEAHATRREGFRETHLPRGHQQRRARRAADARRALTFTGLTYG